jgi:hypothetical protein
VAVGVAALPRRRGAVLARPTMRCHRHPLRRAAAGDLSCAARAVTVERVLTDNGSYYRSHLWRQQCQDLGIAHKRTPLY